MLATWREAEQMPRATKQRVWKRLRGERKRSLVPPQRNTTWVWAVALAAAVLLVWWGSASLRRTADDRDVETPGQAVDVRVDGEHEGAASMHEPTAVVPTTPAIAPAPSPIAPTTDEAPARPRNVAPRRDSDVAAPETPAEPITTLARERDVIARAWSALADGDPGSALQRAAEHEQAFPEGLLAPERRAIAVIARCKRGDQGAAARAQAWLDEQPRSPLAGRVRTACSSP